MNSSWKSIKFGLVLLALPLVATAAASAHLQIVQSSPITVGTETSEAFQDTGKHGIHTVALNREGGVDGRVVSLDSSSKANGVSGLNVRLVKNGKTVASGISDSEGAFSVKDVPEGVYSFVASGDNGFAAYSVRVVPNNSEKYDEFLEAVAVSSEYLPSVISMLDEAASHPKSLNAAPDKDQMDEKIANRVVLKDGVMTGRVLLPKDAKINPQDTLVYILKDGVSVKSAMINELGEYAIPDMKPGVYAFVAVGYQGVAVVAFEAVDYSDAQTQLSSGSVIYVSTAEPVETGGLEVYLVDPQDAVAVQPAESIVYDNSAMLPIEYAGENVACGGACGATAQSCSTCGGCGGGAGGIGGGGRLLGIAGLTLGIIALADNNGGNPPPTSPVDP